MLNFLLALFLNAVAVVQKAFRYYAQESAVTVGRS